MINFFEKGLISYYWEAFGFKMGPGKEGGGN